MERAFKLFDRLLAVMVGTLFLIAVYFLLYRADHLISATRVIVLVVLPLAAATGLLATFALRRQMRANVVLALVFSLGTVYAVEVFLAADPLNLVGGRDPTSRTAHALELQVQGEEAYPVVGSATWLDPPLVVEDDVVLPLSGVPNVTAVMCDEGGGMITYESDRFGFNNDDAVWDRPTELALIGDSFVEGWCVGREDSFAGQIAAEQAGTVNVGYTAHGPLAELGILHEYVADRRPEHVVWFFFEGNDLTEDLLRELDTEILRRYLEEEPTQDLQHRASEVGQEMRRVLDDHLDALADAPQGAGHPVLRWGAAVAKLQTTRTVLGFRAGEDPVHAAADPSTVPLAEFRQVLADASTTVQAWDGTLHFVYLPDFPSADGEEWPYHSAVLEIAHEHADSVTDLTDDFRAHQDPGTLFFLDAGGLLGPVRAHHYNEAGHALVAARVLEALR